MASYFFVGSGTLTIGGSVTVGGITDMTFDFSASMIEFFGAHQYAEAVAPGKRQAKGSCKSGKIDADSGGVAYTVLGLGVGGAMTNNLIGSGSSVAVSWQSVYGGKTLTISLAACYFDTFKVTAKNDAFMIQDLSFAAQDNGSGSIGTMTIA